MRSGSGFPSAAVITSAALLLFGAADAVAQCVYSDANVLLPSSPGASSEFGTSLALGDGLLLVGDPGADVAGVTSGAVIVYEDQNGQWVEVTRLEPPVPIDRQRFGATVDLEGDWAVVGSPGTGAGGNRAGSVFSFLSTGGVWTLDQELSGSAGGPGDEYGLAVEASGNQLTVGQPTRGRGVAYLYRRVGGVLTEFGNLQGSASGERFGASLVTDGLTTYIGAPGIRSGGAAVGGVYVALYQFSWALTSTLVQSPDPAATGFGSALALNDDGNLFVVGENRATVFRQGPIGFQDLITVRLAANPAVSSEAAAFDGEALAGNALRTSGRGELLRGYAGWAHVAHLDPDAAGSGELVGTAVAKRGRVVALGAPARLGGGAVYTMTLPDFFLEASANTVTTGAGVDLHECGGEPGAPVVLFVAGVNGVPTIQVLDRGVFDAAQDYRSSFVVPPGLVGSDFDLQALSFYFGGVQRSPRVTVLVR